MPGQSYAPQTTTSITPAPETESPAVDTENSVAMGEIGTPDNESGTPLLDEYGSLSQSEFDRRVRQVGECMGQLMEARHDIVLDVLKPVAQPVTVPNPNLEMIETAVLTAAGAATAGIGGAVAKHVSGGVSDALKQEFVKSAFKDFIDSQLHEAAGTAFDAVTSGWVKDAGPLHEGFFLSLANGIRFVIPEAKANAEREAERVAMEADDPGAVLADLSNKLPDTIPEAQAVEKAEDLPAWLNLLAQVDLGTGPEGGADLGEMEWKEKTWGEIIAGEPAYGVIRLDFEGGIDTDKPDGYRILGAKMAGSSPEMVAQLNAVDMSLNDLGLNVFAAGDVYAGDPNGHIFTEFGRNDSGAINIGSNDYFGKAWLGFYGRQQKSIIGHTPDEPEWAVAAKEAAVGADALLKRIGSLRPRDLKIEHG